MTTDKTLTKRIRRAACLVGSLLTLALTACVQDEALVLPDRPEPQAPGLHIALAPESTEPEASTRTPGVDALNENRIGTADVFIFKHNGMLNPDGYAHGEGSGPVTVYSGSNWLDNFNKDDAPFSVYVVANYKGSATLSSVTSLDDLKAVTATDKDIVYFEGMNTDNGPFSDKSFLMDGHTEVDYATLEAAPDGQVYDISVPVRRAAAKVELTLQFSNDWKTKYRPRNLLAQVVNYATVTPALADGTPLDASQLGYQSTPDKGGTAEDNFTVGFVTRGANGAIEGSTVRFYAYVNRWDELVENETMLLIDLPGMYYGEDGQQEPGENYAHNFYKIPFIGNAEPQVMERNTFYQVTATVDMLGSTEIDEPVELNNVQFETADWKVDDVSVGEGDTPTYLILSSYHLDLRNVDGYDDLRFYSSSPITSVEFVSGNDALNDPDVDFEFDYPGTGSTIPPIYFVNKDGERQEVNVTDRTIGSGWVPRPNPNYNLVRVSADENVTDGYIHLISPNPDNVTKRYITLKVTNGDGLSKYVVVEQYPLEYIQPIQGYFSYRDDFLSSGQATPNGVVCKWDETFRNGSSRTVPTSNDFFDSKVLRNGTVYTYSYTSRWPTERCWSTSTAQLQNEMMYFVTITQTDSQYNIAHPIMEEVTFSGNDIQLVTSASAENSELVSPAFMLASQLGAVQHDNINGWANARRHCAHYCETYVDSNGETQYLTDWRMPTTAELEIIKRYQTTTPDVMDMVLSGDYYYAADGSDFYADGGTSNRNAPSIRCIRDVLPTDAFLQTNN